MVRLHRRIAGIIGSLQAGAPTSLHHEARALPCASPGELPAHDNVAPDAEMAMSFEPNSGYVAPSNLQELNQPALPIFNIERVEFKFNISSDFVAAQVANNVLILALSSGRILRIDLDSPADIDGRQLSLRATCRLLTRTQILIFQRSRPRLA